MKNAFRLVLVTLSISLFPVLSHAQIFYDEGGTTNTPNSYDNRLSVVCSANKISAVIGQPITWTAYVSGGNGVYAYTWNGSEGFRGSQQSVTTAYSILGIKDASVTVYSNGQQLSAACANTVTIQPGALPSTVSKASIPKITPPAAPVVQNSNTALQYVPWNWVVIGIIFVLLLVIAYLVGNKRHIKHHQHHDK